jgi:hypothetical protein
VNLAAVLDGEDVAIQVQLPANRVKVDVTAVAFGHAGKIAQRNEKFLGKALGIVAKPKKRKSITRPDNSR